MTHEVFEIDFPAGPAGRESTPAQVQPIWQEYSLDDSTRRLAMRLVSI